MMVTPRQRLYSTLALILITSHLALSAEADDRWYYIVDTEDFKTIVTAVGSCRAAEFDNTRVLLQYIDMLRFQLGKTWLELYHGPKTVGPFESKEAAEDSRATHLKRAREADVEIVRLDLPLTCYSAVVVMGPAADAASSEIQTAVRARTLSFRYKCYTSREVDFARDVASGGEYRHRLRKLKPSLFVSICRPGDFMNRESAAARQLHEMLGPQARVLLACVMRQGTPIDPSLAKFKEALEQRGRSVVIVVLDADMAVDRKARAISERVSELLGLPPAIYINELMSKNESAVSDEAGDFDDWIELYNAESRPVDLGGMFFENGVGNGTRYEIPKNDPEKTTIPPGGFLLLWCDEDVSEGPLHASRKLRASGDTATLVMPDGETIVDRAVFGSVPADVSLARTTDGGLQWRLNRSPSPRRSNSLDNIEDDPGDRVLAYSSREFDGAETAANARGDNRFVGRIRLTLMTSTDSEIQMDALRTLLRHEQAGSPAIVDTLIQLSTLAVSGELTNVDDESTRIFLAYALGRVCTGSNRVRAKMLCRPLLQASMPQLKKTGDVAEPHFEDALVHNISKFGGVEVKDFLLAILKADGIHPAVKASALSAPYGKHILTFSTEDRRIYIGFCEEAQVIVQSWSPQYCREVAKTPRFLGSGMSGVEGTLRDVVQARAANAAP